MKNRIFKNPFMMGVLFNIVLSWIQSIFIKESIGDSQINEFVSSSPIWMVFILWLMISIVVPLFEELIFRGLLWRFFLFIFSPLYTFAIVTLVFSFLHPMESAFFLLPFSAYLGWLRLTTGSLRSGVFAHISFNMSGIVFPFVISSVF